jgi:hypothetical protein
MVQPSGSVCRALLCLGGRRLKEIGGDTFV